MMIEEAISLFKTHGYPTLAEDVQRVLARVSDKPLEKNWKPTDLPTSAPMGMGTWFAVAWTAMPVLSFIMLVGLYFK